MQGGFSFCGVDIAKFGLEYVPTLDQTYVYSSGEYTVHQETFDAHHGGYFYGTTVQPKIFTLKCMFQDQDINHGILSNVENFFRRGRTGRLVFKNRDWVWYSATVIEVDTKDLRNYMNGFVTIVLSAFYPFGRCDELYLNDSSLLYEDVAFNSALMIQEDTPDPNIGQLSESTTILLFNAGTEVASVAIEIAGDAGDGVTITNRTTGQTSKFIAFTPSETSDKGKYILCDSLNGKTVLTDGKTAERCFKYHDQGFIELYPAFPIEREVYASYFGGSAVVSTLGTPFDDDIVGRYIKLEGKWRKIIEQIDNSSFIVDVAFDADGFGYSNIVTMNEISIELSPNSNLTRLNFVYKPTFQ